jgi:hypothetical protein
MGAEEAGRATTKCRDGRDQTRFRDCDSPRPSTQQRHERLCQAGARGWTASLSFRPRNSKRETYQGRRSAFGVEGLVATKRPRRRQPGGRDRWNAGVDCEPFAARLKKNAAPEVERGRWSTPGIFQSNLAATATKGYASEQAERGGSHRDR